MADSRSRSPSVSDALTAAGRVLADRPAAVLPAYLLALGALPAARVPLLAALGVVVALLASTGRLEPLVRELGEVARRAREAGDSGAAAQDFPPGLVDALAGVATAKVGAILLAGLLGTLATALVARAIAAAVTRETVWAAVDGRDPLVDGVAGAVRWRTFLGLSLIRLGLLAVVLLVPVALVGAGARADAAAGVVAVLLGVALLGLGLALALVVALLFAFTGPAVVVDDVGALAAIRRSVAFVRAHPGATLAFALVAAGVYVGVGVFVGLASLVGAGRVGAIVLALVVAPALDVFATALYARTGAPARRHPALRTRVRLAVEGGWRELVGFVAGHPLANLAGVALLAAGIAGGHALTAPAGVTVPPPDDVAGVFGPLPVATFGNLAANNWLVAAGSAYGGTAFGLPAAASLLFNGAVVGALAGVFDRTAFLALVAPHGAFELPALSIGGALGLHLGRVGWRAVRGRAPAPEVAGELQRAARVLVGLAVLLVVAAFVEAFLTPRIAAWILE